MNPRIHVLKTDSQVFKAIQDGLKTSEIRFNDRNFRVGDLIDLRGTVFTGSEMRKGRPLIFNGDQLIKQVTHVLSGYGLKEGWVCLSFANVE
jgi:hypothetical protein